MTQRANRPGSAPANQTSDGCRQPDASRIKEDSPDETGIAIADWYRDTLTLR